MLIVGNFMLELNSMNTKTGETDNKRIRLRYVDDALCVINSNTDPNIILQQINLLHRNIKFTIEKEVNRQIKYLNITRY